MAFTDSFYGGLANTADWVTISLAAASLVLILCIMLIMISRLFSLKNIEQVAKTEFVYAISTVLIVMMTVGLVAIVEPMLGGASNSIAKTLYLSSFAVCHDTAHPENIAMCNGAAFPNQQTLIDWMKLYMETPMKCVQSFMEVLYYLSIPVEAIASIYMEIFMSEHAGGFGIKWIAERITNATQSFTFYTFIFYLLVHVFEFIKAYAGFFFSTGVALRSFPPTRGAGAYIMALSFGLYFVFPFSYILIASTSLPHVNSNIVGFSSDANGNSYVCALPSVPTEVLDYRFGAADANKFVGFIQVLNANRDKLTDMLTVKMSGLTTHLVSSLCIFPMLAFMVLLTFVLNTTNLFGGNIPEVGRGLIKLI